MTVQISKFNNKVPLVRILLIFKGTKNFFNTYCSTYFDRLTEAHKKLCSPLPMRVKGILGNKLILLLHGPPFHRSPCINVH